MAPARFGKGAVQADDRAHGFAGKKGSAILPMRTAQMCANACAIALKNVLGLVCDPVAGLVEVPCVKRNAMGVVNALAAAEMALAGVESAIQPMK